MIDNVKRMLPETHLDMIDDVKRIVSAVIKIPIEQLSSDTPLDRLNIDSLDFIEIVYAMEEKFDVEIPLRSGEKTVLISADGSNSEAAALKLDTIADIADALKKLIALKVHE